LLAVPPLQEDACGGLHGGICALGRGRPFSGRPH
jgi:hypothetical protein